MGSVIVPISPVIVRPLHGVAALHSGAGAHEPVTPSQTLHAAAGESAAASGGGGVPASFDEVEDEYPEQ
jgi:hypothetical protein